jgi:NADPH:quinone reductase-like Zn-dependent oxidoreductase
MRKQGSPFVASTNSADLAVLGELIDAGKVTAVVERVYPLEQAPEAFRYLATGHARAKIVIAVASG